MSRERERDGAGDDRLDVHPDVEGRVDKSEGGSGLPRRAEPGGVETGAKRTGAVVALALVAVVVVLVIFGLFTDVL